MPPKRQVTVTKQSDTQLTVYNENISQEIQTLEKCKQTLAEIQDLRSVLEIRDRASAMKNYLKAKNEARETQISASSIIALAEARAGQLIKEGQSSGDIVRRGGDQKTDKKQVNEKERLSDLGIDKNQSQRFQMAAEVLDKDPEWFDKYREECKDNQWDFTQHAVIRKCRKIRNEEIGKTPTPEFVGLYDVIVIDPPWPTTRPEFEQRAATDVGFDYPTMTEVELELLDFPAQDNCHMWLWTTQKFLPMALRLAGYWGFDYCCTFVWIKTKGMQMIGLPYYNCEFALYCRKGSPKFTTTKGLKTAYEWPRGRHSEKPLDFYKEVVRVTEGRRIEIFSRRDIKGFDKWGNEASNTQENGNG